MVKWRIKRGDKIAGEVPSSKVRQLAAAGKLRKTDLLCKEGTEKWVPAGNVKGLWQTNSPSQSQAVSAKDQQTPQAAPTPPLASAQTSPAKAQDAKVQGQTPVQQQATEAVPQQQVAEAPLQQEAFTSSQETVEESADPGVQTFAEPDGEFSEESHQMADDAKAPRRKWLVPLIVGGVGCFLVMGLASAFMRGPEPDVGQRKPKVIQDQQPNTVERRRPSSHAHSNLSLTQEFFQPNIERNVEYTTKKFEKNTTVELYRKTTIERWDSDSALYYHEKDFRNYGQTVPYKVSNGYVQLKAGENWFRFLKVDAKIGDRWTPGDGKDGTLNWTEEGSPSGELELVDFKMVDSIPVAIVEFNAKLGLPVPSYLVPAAFDFGFIEDGIGPIEGKLRFELGQGLGVLRIDSIVPKGMRHRNGGGRDTSDWIFATRRRNVKAQNGDAAE